MKRKSNDIVKNNVKLYEIKKNSSIVNDGVIIM